MPVKNIITFILTFCLIATFNIEADSQLPPPYNSAELLPFNPHGWYSNAGSMEKLFALKKPFVVIEVGCWLGASTRHMASMLPPGGVVYAVDHWLGSIENQQGQDSWFPILPKLYDQFLSNVIHAQLTDKIIPIRKGSLEASEYLEGTYADVVYIDASHDYESVYADLNAWYPFVNGHGTLCGDDWPHPPVQQAVYQFAQEKGLKVVAPEERFWYLTEIKG